MATMDVFSSSAFRTRELSEAINVIPNQWGRIGELGLFVDKPLRQPLFQIESKAGVLQLISASERGTPAPSQNNAKRDMRSFKTHRFTQQSRITADDVSGVRAFGSETEVKQVQDEVVERLEVLRGSIDITREYLRSGALRGIVLDPSGSTLVNLFTDFGVTQKSVDFDWGAAGDPAEQAREVSRHIKTNLKGDVMDGVHSLCSPEYWDKLMANSDFKRSYDNFMELNPQRDDVRDGFYWQGVTWEEYLGQADVPQEDGSSVVRKFVPAGEAMFFPMGTRTTFRQFNAPADYMETVNTPGTPFYAKALPDAQANRFIDIEGQMNTVPICMRPAVLVRGHSTT